MRREDRRRAHQASTAGCSARPADRRRGIHEARPEAIGCGAGLADRYPGDASVAVALLLNLVHLEPGQAIELGPGNLHAYLGGAGIELMNASDNVIPAG